MEERKVEMDGKEGKRGDKKEIDKNKVVEKKKKRNRRDNGWNRRRRRRRKRIWRREGKDK